MFIGAVRTGVRSSQREIQRDSKVQDRASSNALLDGGFSTHASHRSGFVGDPGKQIHVQDSGPAVPLCRSGRALISGLAGFPAMNRGATCEDGRIFRFLAGYGSA
jgi:hypothetical protein